MKNKYIKKIKHLIISLIPEQISNKIRIKRNLNISIIKDKEDYLKYIEKHYQKRILSEKQIADSNINNDYWLTNGFCIICNKSVNFRNNWINFRIDPKLGKMPCYREKMVCPSCGLNNRMRFAAFFLDKKLRGKNLKNTTIYIYEQVTPFFNYVKEKYSKAKIFGSEYLGYNYLPGQIIDGLRHEDAQNLSFESSSIDMLLANDVFEHIPDFNKAITEAFRVLRNKGLLIFTIPFNPSELKTTKRAEIKNGEIIHFLPERYHGNPVSSKGSLVFHDFGWDIIDACQKAGFNKSKMIAYYSLKFGHIGYGIQYLFLAEKNSKRK